MTLANFSSPSFCTCNCSSCNSCLSACIKSFDEVLNSIHRSHSPKLGVNNRCLFTKHYSSYCSGQPAAGATPVRPDLVNPPLPRADSCEPSVTTGPTDLRTPDGSSLAHLLPDGHLPKGLRSSALSPMLHSAHKPEPICGSSGWFWVPLTAPHGSWDPSLQEQKAMEDHRSY